jgi:hypothetical protein
LREALARSDNDFLVAEPRRRKAAPQPSRFGALTRIARIMKHVVNYPNRIAGALLVGIAAAIAVNALELQTSRHPAPFFRHATTLPQQPAPAPQAPQTVPQTMARTARPAVAIAPAPAPEPAATSAPVDPLGQFLRQNDQTPPRHRAAITAEPPVRPDRISQILQEDTGAAPKPNRTVLAVQRALVKLGYVLQADGLDGEATHRAIVQYEGDHHLPTRGELSPKLLRQLSAEAGIAIP